MYYASQTDRQHALRKLAHHRLVARCLRGEKGDDLLDRALGVFRSMETAYGETPFVSGWREVLRHDRHEIARRILARDDVMETLRESSPFMQVHGFDIGRDMPIDFRDPAIRGRMWKLAKRLAMIEPRQPEVHACAQTVPKP